MNRETPGRPVDLSPALAIRRRCEPLHHRVAQNLNQVFQTTLGMFKAIH